MSKETRCDTGPLLPKVRKMSVLKEAFGNV